MPWPKTGATHYHARTGHAINGLVVCYVVWLGSMIYGIRVWICARCVAWFLIVVRMAIELKYCNTPQIHTDTYIRQNSNTQDLPKFVYYFSYLSYISWEILVIHICLELFFFLLVFLIKNPIIFQEILNLYTQLTN